MNIKLIFIAVGVFLSCNNKVNKTITSTNGDVQMPKTAGTYGAYQIYKIDSVGSFYLIYANKNDSSYKIISEKKQGNNCKIIQVDEKYDFVLRNAKDVTIKNETQTLRVYLFNVDCLIYNDSTKICIETGEKKVPALFIANNLKGLCLDGK